MKARTKSSASSSRAVSSAKREVVNGGGLINVNAELAGWSSEQAHRKVGEIYDTILRVLTIAREEHIPSYTAADRLAEHRLAEATAHKLRPRGT